MKSHVLTVSVVITDSNNEPQTDWNRHAAADSGVTPLQTETDGLVSDLCGSPLVWTSSWNVSSTEWVVISVQKLKFESKHVSLFQQQRAHIRQKDIK